MACYNMACPWRNGLGERDSMDAIDGKTLSEEISRMRSEYTELLKLLERISQLSVKEVVVRTYLSGDTTMTGWGQHGGGHVERYLR